jgi:hypothetical protein
MNVARETIYAALFARLSAIPGIVTASRRLKHWDDTPPALQPALFLVQRHEHPHQARGLPAAWTLAVDLYLYAHAGGDPNAAPSQTVNALIDAIEAALDPDPATGVQSLGGLVSHCWIDASGIETDEGALGEQAVAVIPIAITVPG